MDTNMTFRMDSEVKAKMVDICAQIGMTPSTAFNIFANAFVREGGMPFRVALQQSAPVIAQERMPSDTDPILEAFSHDYKKLV